MYHRDPLRRQVKRGPDRPRRPAGAGSLHPVWRGSAPKAMSPRCRDVPNAPAHPVGFCPETRPAALWSGFCRLGIRHAGGCPWNEHEPMPCRSPCYLPPRYSRQGHPSYLPPRTRSANRPTVTST